MLDIKDPPDSEKYLAQTKEVHIARYLSRVPLRTSYNRVAEKAVQKVLALEVEPGTQIYFAFDATGVSRGVRPIIRKALDEALSRMGKRAPHVILKPCTITAGSSVSAEKGFLNISKRVLIHQTVTAMQNTQENNKIIGKAKPPREPELRIAKNSKSRDILVDELMEYRFKTTQAGNDVYEPWRVGEHDDLLFAFCLAEFMAQRYYKSGGAVDMPPELRVGSERPARRPWYSVGGGR